jgi:hypothetical protein
LIHCHLMGEHELVPNHRKFPKSPTFAHIFSQTTKPLLLFLKIKTPREGNQEVSKGVISKPLGLNNHSSLITHRTRSWLGI